MTGRNSHYSAVAIVLHWTIAILILTNLMLGWRMGFLTGMAQFTMFQLHKSVGITVLALSLARLVWRFIIPPPPFSTALKPWERAVAYGTHMMFYVIMIVMPLTGWVMVSVSPLNIPTLLWSHIPLPHIGFLHDLPAAQKTDVEAGSGTIHVVLAIGAVTLIVLHAGAALKHQFVDRDGTLARMLPVVRSFSKSGNSK